MFSPLNSVDFEPVSMEDARALYGIDIPVAPFTRAAQVPERSWLYGVDDAGVLWCVVYHYWLYDKYYWDVEAKTWRWARWT